MGRRIYHHRHTAMRERDLERFYEQHTWVSAGYPNAQWVRNTVLERVHEVCPDTQNYAQVLTMVRSGAYDAEPEGDEEE